MSHEDDPTRSQAIPQRHFFPVQGGHQLLAKLRITPREATIKGIFLRFKWDFNGFQRIGEENQVQLEIPLNGAFNGKIIYKCLSTRVCYQRVCIHKKREETGKPNRNQQNWDGSVKMERNQQINMKINKLPMAVFWKEHDIEFRKRPGKRTTIPSSQQFDVRILIKYLIHACV